MADFLELRDAHFDHVRLHDVHLHRTVVRGAEVRSLYLEGGTMRGVELVDVDISGELVNVVVNGVEIAPLVDAELNRRTPERALMRPTDADGHLAAWDVLERRWGETVARAAALPEALLHRQVDGEWSFIETLRHLGFATAAWVGRMVLGDPSPWHRLDLPWDEAPGWDDIPRDRTVEPTLDEVLALRAARQAMVRDVLTALTDEQLATTVTQTEPGWPQLEDFPLRECLLIVLNEEWEHRNFAERDLDALTTTSEED